MSILAPGGGGRPLAPIRLWWATVYTADLQAAIRFYGELLGLPTRFVREDAAYASFAPEGALLDVEVVDPASPLRGRETGLVLGVVDLEGTYESLITSGVTGLQAPQRHAWGDLMAVICDPDLNRLTLAELSDEDI